MKKMESMYRAGLHSNHLSHTTRKFMGKYLIGYLTLIVLISVSAFPFQQNGDPSASTTRMTIVPGPEYDAGWLHRLLYGSNWRSLWTTQVNAEVLDLQHFAGGLRPIRIGGGKQTKSLRFKGSNGKEYKFRSIDKDARKSLPEDLRESIAADYLQDQISSVNPV